MSEREPKPKFLSDFDGTAVRKYGYTNWRNWGKYPLPGIPGYLDFINGVLQEDVEFGGVVTIRGRMRRSLVTRLSLWRLGYRGTISPDMVRYTGKEEAKGRFIAEQARRTTVGMIDDKPHKLGGAILDAVEGSSRSGTHHPLLLGVVSHERSLEHMQELLDRAEGDSEVSVDAPAFWTGEDFTVTKGPLAMHVTQLGPYSEASGQEFAQRLHGLEA